MPDKQLVPVQYAIANFAPIDVIAESWLATLDSANTRRVYRSGWKEAREQLGELEHWTPETLVKYREQLVSRLKEDAENHLSPSAVLQRLNALRSFLRFCRITGQSALTKEMIAFALKSVQATVIKPYQVLTLEECHQLVGAARANLRDRVLLEFVLSTGLRASEVCAVRVRDLTRDEQGDWVLHVRMGKGRKDRLVPLSQDSDMVVRAYLSSRKIHVGDSKHADDFLFPSRKGKGQGRLSAKRIWEIVAKYAKAAGVEKTISPHSLRHTAAITWLNEDAPLPAVQKILGHSSITTTQRYLDHLNMKQLKDVVNHKRKKE